MVAISSRLPNIAASAKRTGNIAAKCKGMGLGGLLGAAICIPDFINVPGAFSLKYNTDGEKVDGINWKSGLKELGKSVIKCATFMTLPALMLGMSTGGAIAAGVLGLASFIVPMMISEKLADVMPHEQDLVAEACKKKGINPDSDENHKIDQMT